MGVSGQLYTPRTLSVRTAALVPPDRLGELQRYNRTFPAL